MVITNLEEKENRKIWVPIRGGNRGGWSLFDWEKVREMPYRDRQMYLGNSAKIGVLDKGGKWRKKDWYLKRNQLTASQLDQMRSQAMRKDQQRMNTALGYVQKDDDQALTPAEMQLLLKKIKGGGVQQPVKVQGDAIGLGFDKTKVEIRAKPSAKVGQNPHRLEGSFPQQEMQPRQRQKKEEKSKKKHKKHKKQHKHRQRSRSRDSSHNQHRRRFKQDDISYQHEKREKRNISKSVQKQKHRSRRNHQSSQSKEREKHRKRQKYQDSKYRDSQRYEKQHEKRKSKKDKYYSQSD